MTTWKLIRQRFGNGEFLLSEGEEITVGRGANNNITLTSIVVSRNHCILKVHKDKVVITDLKSSNGVYVGVKKIPQNIPFELEEGDIIGFGWTIGAPAADISDEQKYVFKLFKETQTSSASRIRFQSENEDSSVEAEIAALEEDLQVRQNRDVQSPILDIKTGLKRKLDTLNENEIKIRDIKKNCTNPNINSDVINISDSENELKVTNDNIKIPKTEPHPVTPFNEDIKIENKLGTDEVDFEAFEVKQEYYDDEPIEIESDNESEDDHWAFRLSQSSPGKPVIKAALAKKADLNQEEHSYSQLDDFFDDEDDIIVIPPQPPVSETNESIKKTSISEIPEKIMLNTVNNKETSNFENIIQNFDNHLQNYTDIKNFELVCNDQVDGIAIDKMTKESDSGKNTTSAEIPFEKVKKTQIIDVPTQLHRRKSELESKSKTISKSKKDRRQSSSKRHISNSQKEERKKKLKEIAEKEKSEAEKSNKSYSNSKPEKMCVNAKVTASNRGAFLSNETPSSSKSVKKKESPQKTKDKKIDKESLPKNNADCSKSNVNIENKKVDTHAKIKDKKMDKEILSKHGSQRKESTESIENKKKHASKSKDKIIGKDKSPKHDDEQRESNENIENKKNNKIKNDHKGDTKPKTATSKKTESATTTTEPRKPLKSLKPLSESEKSCLGKPFSKVEPLSHEPVTDFNSKPESKSKKKVRFSEQAPIVHEFVIEEGNKMKKTSLAKSNLVTEYKPVFSLEKVILIRILRWNPYWLEEQMKMDVPPPILGHNNMPMTIFHSFSSHNQYVEQVGDLLLMEIWECLTQGHLKLRNQGAGVEMIVKSVPHAPARERHFELFNISVNITIPNAEVKRVPKTGDILIGDFGQQNTKNRRFFFVHNVRSLPSRPNSNYSLFSISLHSCYTDKMKLLQPGAIMYGYTLAYINKELMLFDAMEYLAGSPLSEAILRPEPRHFVRCDPNVLNNTNIQWTKTLNRSQQMAVNASLVAALGDRPSIQMVQGPPGTGKSSVICAIVMSYFYDVNGKKYQNRGKILICATSNTAVDEIVIRLLNIRKDLPKMERFRMVRVGRADAMNPRARDVSSQVLAQRDASRVQEPANPAANEEYMTKIKHYLNKYIEANPISSKDSVSVAQAFVNNIILERKIVTDRGTELMSQILYLEAKRNMWRTQAEDAQAANNPERVAFCQTRVNQLNDRIALVRCGTGGRGGALSGEAMSRTERRIIEGADIVATTLASAHNHKMRGLKGRIALCIVDEAGQAIEPETLIPLTLDVTRLTLIGDPQQLPGFICSQRAKQHGLGESLFSRLASCSESWGSVDGSAVHVLDQQYRMHAAIADFPNRAFYAGGVSSCGPPRPDLRLPPYKLLAISSGDRGQVMGANEMEAWAVSRVVAAAAAAITRASVPLSIAVITPYNNHKELLKTNLKHINDPPCAQVEVNTVDSFQGQERDVVIVSLARSQGVGFLIDAGRMNVMLTRARHALLVCLNPHAVMKNPLWRSLVEDAQKRNLYKELPNRMCQPSNSNSIAVEEVLSYINDNP